MQQVVGAEPRPPRQIDGTIPGELERICLKALAKRASERYTTARDLADDLRHFLDDASWAAADSGAPAGRRTGREPAPRRPEAVGLGLAPIRIVPKGLGSFDEHDADFFLELLPGPRDRDGLPDGLRFWKTRIEATDPDRAFRVGLIYGPSGCGKSSMVKAGLLPRLAPQVVRDLRRGDAATETEARLLPRPPPASSRPCPPTAAWPRPEGPPPRPRAAGGPQGAAGPRPVRAVALRPARRARRPSWSRALRQCDGEHVQALCLVRDDFWMAATRFMKELDIDLVPERNIGGRRPLRAAARAQGAGGLRPRLRRPAAAIRRPLAGPGRLPRPGGRRAGAGRPDRAGAAGAVRRDGQGPALDAGDPARGRRHGGRRRQVPRGYASARPGRTRITAITRGRRRRSSRRCCPRPTPTSRGGCGRSRSCARSRATPTGRRTSPT